MYSAVYLEYEAGQRPQELRGAPKRSLRVAELQRERSDSRRSRLTRRLATLGHRTDSHAASSSASMRSVGR